MELSRVVTTRRWLITVVLLCAGCEPAIPKSSSTSTKEATSTKDEKANESRGLQRLIILTNGDSPYWDACNEGLRAANSELRLKDRGLRAVLDKNDGTPQGQLSKLQQYATQDDIVGVGISATDADNVAIADEMRAMRKRGVSVITIDSDVDRNLFRDARYAFIGTDNLTGGKVLGACAKGLKPSGGEYVTFVGRTGAQNAKERIGGFAEGAGDDFKAKDSMADGTDPARARENVRNAIQNHPKVSVLVGIWSYNAPAIVDIVKEVNRRSDFTTVVFDAEPTAISAMAEGNIDAMVVQNPFQMGYQGVRLLAALSRERDEIIREMFPHPNEPDGDIYDTGLKVVVPNAESPLKPAQFDKQVEFTTLSKFQEWLKKYGLTGS